MHDHENFHATFHFNCVSCEDIIRVLPNFNFFTLNKVQKGLGGVGFDHSNLKNKITESFNRQETLNRHIKTVHLLCKYCGKEFIKKRKLDIHMRGVHEGIENEPFKCYVCGKYVENKKKHEESMKNCKFCSENFCTSRALGAHLNAKHTYIYCQFCGQEFSKTSNLDPHLRMCTSRPKVCHVCGLVLCNSGTLGTHTIMEHSKNKR